MITRIYTREYVVLDYDSSVPCVIATRLEFIAIQEFEDYLNFGLDFMKEKIKETGRMLWLVDLRFSSITHPDSVQWLIESWNPRAFEAGIKHIALVVPDEEWVKVPAEEYCEETEKKQGITTVCFKDVESARRWFMEDIGISRS
ncbi:MAG TPA: hypothetical protein VIN08_16520 [Ohtaekwangia sp.]|uniref:hypothetical protein n=1 Tax=Ohtaekwangia sp. TaxID=2066019 RepID=UPI002F94BDC7